MIEREIKLIVSEIELLQYRRILDDRIKPVKKLQINYYFDTLDFQLNSLGNSLRIRQENGRLTLQYKYEKQYTGDEKICKEFETAVQVPPKCILSKDLPCSALNPYKSYYWGKCDFELEIEFQDHEKAEEVLALLSIEKAKIHQIGKYDRFVEELQKLRGRLSI